MPEDVFEAVEIASGRRSLMRYIEGAFRLTQPFETVLMQALPATLFMRLAAPGIGIGRLSILFFAVITIYGAVGALNDYYDYALDCTTKPKKPLVRGLVTKRFAVWQAVVLAPVGLALSLSLNGLTMFFSGLILALGIWYDVYAKRSIWSWVPYAIGIPTLPLWGYAGAGRFERALLLAYPLGAMLSVALNMSNTMPDHAGDSAFGLKALTHRLPLERALQLNWTLYAAAIIGFAISAPFVGNDWRILGPGLVCGAAILIALIIDYSLHRSQASLKRAWPGGALLGVVVGLCWVASLPRH